MESFHDEFKASVDDKKLDPFTVINLDTNSSENDESTRHNSQENLPRELKALKRARLLNRLLYLLASVFLMIVFFVSLLSMRDITTILSLFFISVFSVILCSFEIGITFLTKQIAINFGFLYNVSGRVLLTVILMSLLLSINSNPITIACVAYLAFVLLVFVITTLSHSNYGTFVRNEHYYAWEQGRWFV